MKSNSVFERQQSNVDVFSDGITARIAIMLSCKCRRHVADMSATCDTVAGFRPHGAVTATQNLTVPTPYIGISMYVGRSTFSDDTFAKCVDIQHFRGKFAPPSRHDTANICS